MIKFLKFIWFISFIAFMYHIIFSYDMAWLNAPQLAGLSFVIIVLGIVIGVAISQGYDID